MTDDQWRSKVACPGDPDLDLDLHGLTINAVVSTDHEIIVSFINGSGWWIISGERHDILKVTEMTISMDVRSAETIHTIPAFVATFERWRDAMTELRVCAAPGRLTAVIAPPTIGFLFLAGGRHHATPETEPGTLPVCVGPGRRWNRTLNGLAVGGALKSLR